MTPLRPVILGAVGVASLAVGGVLMALVGLAVGLPSHKADVAITFRGLLPLAFVLLTTRVLAGWGTRRGTDGAVGLVVVAVVTAYLLNPFSWDGRAGVAQLVADPGPVTFVVDLALWFAAGTLGAVWGSHEAERPARMPTPYG